MITAVLFVVAASGGAVGRSVLTSRLNGVSGMPWGTLLVNASGSLALGLLSGWGPPALTVLGVAGVGAYTTFSTFSVEVVRLVAERRHDQAAAYIALSLVTCTAAAWAGLAMAS